MSIPMAGSTLAPEQKKEWDDLVASNDLVLFMKGTPDEPQCGFSSRAADVLKALEVPFAHVNIFDGDPMKTIQALAEWADFPTLPMVWVKGELIGGSDIALEMYESGELAQMLGKAS